MDNLQLSQELRSLCFNTGWNYAIFWKLNHQTPMVLTLENAYYDNHELHGPLKNESSDKAGRSSCGGQFVNNSLGLALVKISGHVYSLGEGIVGHVATTNKHLWFSSDKNATDVCSWLKYYDGWLTQLLAGIKTIAVVAVVPHGVVQLGSFSSISEDLNLVKHIRDTMVKLHKCIPGYNSSMDCSPCLFNESCRSSVSRNYYDRIMISSDGLYKEFTFEASNGRHPKGISSASYSKCNEQMEKPKELHTISRRKARYGKKCRHRPRDRQLIQNHIKELRELVPDGSKCSIDLLLERTIKHMLFMQCTTEQADKLDICTQLKVAGQEIMTRGSSNNEQGSSWAMEVGNHLRFLLVTVENTDTSGRMLIKMLCEDCSLFLEIEKTIRSLGLTILKGNTEVYSGKILIYYLVEGKKNKNMHRTDVLCSLLRILQQKACI